MKKSKFYLLSGFLGLVVTTLLVSQLASADELDVNNYRRGQNFDPARHEEMLANRESMSEQHQALLEAIENRDYEAWKSIIDSRPKITDFVTADNFETFAQMHDYMQAGDFEQAKALREELGIEGVGFGMGGHHAMKGMHKGFGMGKNLSEQSEN